MNQLNFSIAATAAVVFVAISCSAGQASAQSAGWSTSLSTNSHNVTGLVTIIDSNTIEIVDFTFDGGGDDVYFYLGATESNADFENGLELGSNLLGPPFDGSQGPIILELPSGETIAGYHSISVWCTTFSINFGSGTFQAQSVPEPSSLMLILGASIFAVVRRRR